MNSPFQTKPDGKDDPDYSFNLPASHSNSEEYTRDGYPPLEPHEVKRACYWASVGMAGVALALFPSLAGCDIPLSNQPAPSSQETSGLRTAPGGQKERQVAFLNEIRSADPAARTIDRALLNEQNELGLILDRSVELDKIPALMRLMLAKMAAQFPGEDLTILAYTPSNRPQKVGTARLNAQTRDMTYTPE